MTFFEREPEKPQPVPQAADADLDLALSRQPRLYFLDRRVGMLDDVHPEGFVMRRKLRLAAYPPPPSGRLTSRPPAPERLVDVRHADPVSYTHLTLPTTPYV